jgi:hypothetical protein
LGPVRHLQLTFGLGLWMSLSGCHCGPGSLGGAAVGFTVSGATVDFGRVLEGNQESRLVTLVSAGSVDLTVAVSTSGVPFGAPASVTVPRGGQVDVSVVFTAGDTAADGTLNLSAHGQTLSVPLQGVGVAPLDCTPDASCVVSQFDLPSGTCIQSQAPDGTACTPSSDCLDNGQCQAGQCDGSPRDCDDGNACTNDACAEGQGCVHTPVSCPPPAHLCQQAICSPSSGCGTTNAPDETACGPINCVSASLCFGGMCETIPTPDGVPCAPPTPCRAGGTCQSHQCVVPDAGDLVSVFALPLTTVPTLGPDPAPALLAYGGNVFWTACDPTDGGCALVSYTPNGFQRFVQPLPDARPRWLVAAGDAGVVLAAADVLEAYDIELGTLLWSVPATALVPPPQTPGGFARTSPARAVLTADGALTAAFSWWPAPDAGASDAGTDAGPAAGVQTLVRVAVDGGILLNGWLQGQGSQSVLAATANGGLFLYDSTGPVAQAAAIDGGWEVQGVGLWPGAPSLATSNGVLLVGAITLVPLDGGASEPLAVQDGGAPFYPLPGVVVASDGEAYALQAACEPPLVDPCADVDKTTYVTALELPNGVLDWTAEAAVSGVPVRFAEGVVVQGGVGVVTLSEISPDAGVESHVEGFAAGQRLFDCRIPPPGTLGAGVFDNGTLYVLFERDDAWWLEGYPLAGLGFEPTGWPQRNGVAGTRAEP